MGAAIQSRSLSSPGHQHFIGTPTRQAVPALGWKFAEETEQSFSLKKRPVDAYKATTKVALNLRRCFSFKKKKKDKQP